MIQKMVKITKEAHDLLVRRVASKLNQVSENQNPLQQIDLETLEEAVGALKASDEKTIPTIEITEAAYNLIKANFDYGQKRKALMDLRFGNARQRLSLGARKKALLTLDSAYQDCAFWAREHFNDYLDTLWAMRDSAIPKNERIVRNADHLSFTLSPLDEHLRTLFLRDSENFFDMSDNVSHIGSQFWPTNSLRDIKLPSIVYEKRKAAMGAEALKVG